MTTEKPVLSIFESRKILEGIQPGLLTYIPVKSHGRINVIKCISDCMILISFPGLDVA
jgi:hypothetical protein